jgi:hypothetical protein
MVILRFTAGTWANEQQPAQGRTITAFWPSLTGCDIIAHPLKPISNLRFEESIHGEVLRNSAFCYERECNRNQTCNKWVTMVQSCTAAEYTPAVPIA